jgi:predicted permease
MSSKDLLTLFVSSFEASVSVLLTLSYGILATRLKLITGDTPRDISRLCVNMFLPALLITNVGSELKLENFRNYVPVFCKPCPPSSARPDH